MSYEGVTKFGQKGTIISDIRSVPGENITQEQWDSIFGAKSRKNITTHVKYLDDKKIEDKIWFEDNDLHQLKVEISYKDGNKKIISYYINKDRKNENYAI